MPEWVLVWPGYVALLFAIFLLLASFCALIGALLDALAYRFGRVQDRRPWR